MVKWIMRCVTSTTFIMLINCVALDFFYPSRGLCRGCSLSLYIFLLANEDLIKSLKIATIQRDIIRGKVGFSKVLTHILFVDYVLLFFMNLF